MNCLTTKSFKDYYWLNNESRAYLAKDEGYLRKGVEPEDRLREIALHAESILGFPGFADKFLNYLAEGFYSMSTPIWTNFGNDRGLGVSCFGGVLEDSIDSILDKVAEVGKMCKVGGGTSNYFGFVRPRGTPISKGGFSSGSVHFMELFDKTASVISQGSSRRGSFAAYLPIDHSDIEEFLKIRSEGHPIQEMSIGVCISDKWMEEMITGDKAKRRIWGLVLKKRFETGYPYIFFTDTVNRLAPDVYKDKGYTIWASNLCSEICLPANSENSFVCVLSSLNLLHWDRIKETDAVETLIYFLDAVNEEFVRKTEGVRFMEAAHNFAKNHRALGAGVLGWHSYLQSKMISFESLEAKILNKEIFKEISKRANKASIELAEKLGEPEVLKGYGRRNTTLLAIAPTTSSSFILGQVSSGIEPLHSNYFTKKLAKTSYTYKNPFLIELLKKYGKNSNEVWESILIQNGSVQHLDFLSQEEKDVFKTFSEINQMDIVIQAAQRQKYIDQSQSLNLMIPSNVKPKLVSELLIEGWKMGIKTFYYQRSSSPTADLVKSLVQCSSCES
jgi:ribonucleoside-diphosphate reductase alpha chain